MIGSDIYISVFFLLFLVDFDQLGPLVFIFFELEHSVLHFWEDRRQGLEVRRNHKIDESHLALSNIRGLPITQ